MKLNVRSVTKNDKEWINDVIIKEWGSDFIITNDTIYRPKDLTGIIIEENGEKIGLLTYIIENNECKIISLNSLKQNKGAGTLLLDALKKTAKEKGAKKIVLETTNDNLNALRFYQIRGFQIIAVYPNAIDEARKTKPQIPLIGENNIPLRDALKLELNLQ